MIDADPLVRAEQWDAFDDPQATAYLVRDLVQEVRDLRAKAEEVDEMTECALASQSFFQQERDRADAAEAHLEAQTAALTALRTYVQHLPDCPALPANHDRFTRNSASFRACWCGLADLS